MKFSYHKNDTDINLETSEKETSNTIKPIVIILSIILGGKEIIEVLLPYLIR